MAVITETAGDAAAELADASYALNLGDTFEGTFEDNEDVDLVRVELAADTIYDFRLTAENGTDSAAYDYTKRVELVLYDSAGREIRDGAEMPGGSVLILQPPAAGTYYLKAHAPHKGVSGNYEITLVENTIPVGSHDELAAFLVDDYWEGPAPRSILSPSEDGLLTYNDQAMSEAHQTLARLSLETWADIIPVRFEFAEQDADITFSYSEHGDNRADVYTGDVFLAASGQDSLFVYIHEVGHLLGLGHPGHYPLENATEPHFFGNSETEYLLDSTQATIMSYIHTHRTTFIDADYNLPVTPMVADIIAVQSIYGVADTTRNGDTVYGYQTNAGGHLGEFFALWTGQRNPLIDVHVGSDNQPTLVDIDGDGDLDLVVHGRVDGTGIEFHENTGDSENPVFTPREGDANPFDVVGAYTFGEIRFGDLDGDGDQDLILWNYNYYENTGTSAAPAFAQRSGAANPLEGLRALGAESYTPYPVDLDNDGDLDFVVSGYDQDNQHFHFGYAENTGTATTPAFTLREADANPFEEITSTRPSLALADLDNDNDLDLVVSQGEDYALDYHENTGSPESPAFTDVTGEDDPFHATAYFIAASPALVDLDGDNDLDLAVGRYDGHISYLVNAGTQDAPDYQPTHYTSTANTGPGLTLYDTGGTDTLDVRTDHADQTIDLRPEGISSVYGARGNLVIARGTVIENVVAGHGDDTVIGNDAANVLDGRAGNDVLRGGPGADSLSGGPGQDTASYSGSPDGVTVRLHNISAAANGDAEGDTFPSTVNVAYTDADGVEQTESVPDIEHLIGSSHNDILAGDSRDNRLVGGAGDDTLYGGPGGGDDVMAGSSGNDRLFGGQGDDTLNGGAGDDSLAGGPGGDVFVFGPGDGADTVTDFASGTDKVDLTAFEVESVDDVSMATGDDGVTIDLTDIDGGSILLADITTLPAAGDFLV